MRKGSQYAADPALVSLAASLKNIHFDIEPEDVTQFLQAQMDGRTRNISFCPDGKTYRVRLYLGGKQRLLGLTLSGPTAARFADMARIFFWPYRLRDCREPLASDMNYTVELANQDLADNEPAIALLNAIKDHLIHYGMLAVIEPGKKDGRRTARHEIAVLREEMAAAYEAHAKEPAKYFEQIKTAFHHILDRLTALEENTKQRDL